MTKSLKTLEQQINQHKTGRHEPDAVQEMAVSDHYEMMEFNIDYLYGDIELFKV